jgi:hypothetical protein
MHVEVLGFDCPACRKTFRLIEETTSEQGITIRLEKVDDPARIVDCRHFQPSAQDWRIQPVDATH